MNFTQILQLVGPVVVGLIPKLAPFATVIIHAITEAQQLQGADGAAKKAHALAIVRDAAVVARGTGVKGFESPDEIVSIADNVIDVVVGVVKVIEGTKKAA